jgi:hypothetical protein
VGEFINSRKSTCIIFTDKLAINNFKNTNQVVEIYV